MKRAAVILAGGAGTRLRPLSSEENPKQFLKLFDGRSLIQLTFERLVRLLDPAAIFVSTNEQYRAKTLEHLPGLPPENVLAEPARRNTAPAVALCMFEIEKRFGEDVTVAFVHSDAYIGDVAEFVRILGRAYQFAESSDYFVTVGIEPTEPHTGYGYLELGDALAPEIIELRRFVEKPSLERATEFLAAGNYAWNSGMFVWRSSVFRRELEIAAPEIANVTRENYESMPSVAIDVALMEKAPRVATIRGEFGWSDVGSFEALRAVLGDRWSVIEEALRSPDTATITDH